jgi:hypothetical protein
MGNDQAYVRAIYECVCVCVCVCVQCMSVYDCVCMMRMCAFAYPYPRESVIPETHSFATISSTTELENIGEIHTLSSM